MPQTMGACEALSCLVLLSLLVSSSASTLDDACKSLGASNEDISYDSCIRFFRAFSASATADKRGLVVIAAKIVRAEAANTRNRINALKASETDRKIARRLSHCHALYTSTLHLLNAVAKAIKSGHLQDAEANLNAAMENPDACEEGFRELGVRPPVAAEDYEFTQGCSIALAIASTL
ncbi:putative invertase inhibitor [Aegilops tauschii subsp. strangulata]|nr:pectinesterase inhibitor 12-like [Aegilops tauschii subsp. strangulata]